MTSLDAHFIKPSMQEDALGQVACDLFLGYLAGLPTTVLAQHFNCPVSRINRMIRKTAASLLDNNGTVYERGMPSHLSRLRNESTLWAFRLAIAISDEVASDLRTEIWDDMEEDVGEVYKSLLALVLAQRLRLGESKPVQPLQIKRRLLSETAEMGEQAR